MIIPSPLPKRKPRIEIIPLIDIIFFLLATFVMVSLSMVKNHGISVDLPKAATGSAQERDESVAISIQVGGKYFFNKDEVSFEQLSEELNHLKETLPDSRIFINADQKVEFGEAIGVLDLVRKLGFHKVSIETRPQ